MSDDKPCDGHCEDCDCEFPADRNTVFVQELVDTVYAAIKQNFGMDADDMSDTDFEIVAAAVLSLVKVNLEQDLEVFDLKDIKSPSPENVN